MKKVKKAVKTGCKSSAGNGISTHGKEKYHGNNGYTSDDRRVFQCDEIIRSLEYISKIVKNNMPWKTEEIAEDVAHIL